MLEEIPVYRPTKFRRAGVKTVFGTLFKQDFAEADEQDEGIPERLADDFRERVKATLRVIMKWKGGDHVGPHGFPCRKCRPFPYLVYYQLEGDTLLVLGLVHECRHPDYLRRGLEDGLRVRFIQARD